MTSLRSSIEGTFFLIDSGNCRVILYSEMHECEITHKLAEWPLYGLLDLMDENWMSALAS